MNKDAIIQNCRRLFAFYEDKATSLAELINKAPETPEGLFWAYGKLLDINGAPPFGLSLIYLDKQDYEEAKTWAIDKENYKSPQKLFQDADENVKNMLPGMMAGALFLERFSFLYDGYYWTVMLKN